MAVKAQLRKVNPQPDVFLDESEQIMVFKDEDSYKLYGYIEFPGQKKILLNPLERYAKRMRKLGESNFQPYQIMLLYDKTLSSLTPNEISKLSPEMEYHLVTYQSEDASIRLTREDIKATAEESLRLLRGSDKSRYMILLEGVGAEVYVHDLDEEQKDQLQELGEELDRTDILEVLGVDDLRVKRDGAYFSGIEPYPQAYHISVYDLEGTLVWESDDEFFMDDIGDEEDEELFSMRTEDVLLYREEFEGLFKVFMLDIADGFDPERLNFLSLNICGHYLLMDKLTYFDSALPSNGEIILVPNGWVSKIL